LFYSKKRLLRVLLDETPAAVRNQGMLKNRTHFMNFLKARMQSSPGTFADPETMAFVIVHAIIGALHGTVLDGQVDLAPEALSLELSRLIQSYLGASTPKSEI